MAESEIVTGPYRWTRDLYSKLATAAGCGHSFKFRKLAKEGNVQKTQYVQILTGSDSDIAYIERIADGAREKIEEITRAKFPGSKMFTKEANAHREYLVSTMPVENMMGDKT